MNNLLKYIQDAESQKTSIGHFNVSDLVALKAVFTAGRELNLPIIIGVSEGERDFIGVKQIAALIKSLREEYNYPVFLNADHTHSLDKIKEAAEAGFDAVVADFSKLGLEENIKKTREAVQIAKRISPDILVEGEVNPIKGSSVILKPSNITKSDVQRESTSIFGTSDFGEDLTKPEDAARFVKETGVDLLAPAVGNVHGMLANAPNPKLDIERIKKIKEAVKIPFVLHGGSGISDEDFVKAIDAGISIIHINTEIRLAWREGLEEALKLNPDEITPYKLLPGAQERIKEIVKSRLKLFSKI